jgi:hypothetical protein
MPEQGLDQGSREMGFAGTNITFQKHNVTRLKLRTQKHRVSGGFFRVFEGKREGLFGHDAW